MQVYQQMAGAVSESASLASFATPELRGLFEEWARSVQEEIVAFVKEKGTCKPSEIADKLKISEESALHFVVRMARERSLRITEIRPI